MRRGVVVGLLGFTIATGAAVTYFSQPEESRQSVYYHDGLRVIVDTNTEHLNERVKNLLSVSPQNGYGWNVVGLDYDGDGKMDKALSVRGNVPKQYSTSIGLTALLDEAKKSSQSHQTLSASMPGNVPSAK